MTGSFNERHAARSRAVCAAMAEAADTGKRRLTGRERGILDMWPKYEDGECVWFGDAAEAHGGGIIVEAIEFTRGAVRIKDAADGDWKASMYAVHPLRRPAPDSWERLEEDAGKEPCDYFGVECDDDRGCSGCPHLHEGRDCTIALQADLVRRAKALAGVE